MREPGLDEDVDPTTFPLAPRLGGPGSQSPPRSDQRELVGQVAQPLTAAASAAARSVASQVKSGNSRPKCP